MMMSRLGIAIVGLLVGLAGGGAGVYYWLGGHEAGRRGPAAVAVRGGSEDLAAGLGGHEGVGSEGEEAVTGDGDVVEIPGEAIQEYGIETAVAGGGVLETVLSAPGEIVLNADRVAHIVPRVGGIIREVRKTLGDTVEGGDVLAVMDSRELAEAKAADLSAEARLRLAESQFKRVEGLWKQKVASEQQYQEGLQGLEEARIVHRQTMAKLHALGLAHDEVTAVPDQDDADFSRCELKAPFAATIVDKHATLGEVRDGSSDVFVLADLSTVWVDITVYPQDAARVRVGSKVRVWAAGAGGEKVKADGTIAYISPLIRESTRTGLARAVISNEKGFWRPGLFVTAEIVTGADQAEVLVPNDAIQTIENRPVVFVGEKGKFEKRVVVPGRSNEAQTEVKSGLKAGERYVAKGAFVLKAEMRKGMGGDED